MIVAKDIPIPPISVVKVGRNDEIIAINSAVNNGIPTTKNGA